MSHYVDQELDITDENCIVEALKAMGFSETDIVREKDRHLIGYQGDAREQTADVTLLRRATGSASNDIGFAKQDDGTYKLIISEYDVSLTKGNHRKMGNFVPRFKTEYAVEMTKKQCQSQEGRGWTFKRTTHQGKTRLILRRK